MTELATFSLKEWQIEALDKAFPEDEDFLGSRYDNGKPGIMLAQIKPGNGCMYAAAQYVPHRIAIKLVRIIRDFNERFFHFPYRHMWE